MDKKEYARQYYLKNKERISEQRAEYRQGKKDELAAYAAKYRAQNKEKISERARQYRERNKEQIASYASSWYEQNVERVRENAKRYREENREMLNEKKRLRRAELREQGTVKLFEVSDDI